MYVKIFHVMYACGLRFTALPVYISCKYDKRININCITVTLGVNKMCITANVKYIFVGVAKYFMRYPTAVHYTSMPSTYSSTARNDKFWILRDIFRERCERSPIMLNIRCRKITLNIITRSTNIVFYNVR